MQDKFNVGYVTATRSHATDSAALFRCYAGYSVCVEDPGDHPWEHQHKQGQELNGTSHHAACLGVGQRSA